ncbi:cytochrome ubiquinol oxidase subunit I [Denitrificimonas caeni]|uniref:Cytochrome ubiquinol oxidase subunit I n=1 Tax=Denitrificimonas caeni TaxID=521720 RepID=A0AAE9VND5_9GAMM|nr:cytochrome ubiquinol oxidase subunit I [Denitrificimonas caeni]WBE25350.1 cytochrome ubiquinol oxidase subunit I [Denitrificimonas caeni]
MELDPVILSRLQFAFTISFHIVFPAFTIGLAAWITTLQGMWLYTDNEKYHDLVKFWIKVFAVSFGVGVVTGIIMTFQFGTNWSNYAEGVGNVVAPLIGYEVLTAFFLEATFLGLMLFGAGRVPRWLHFVACVIVVLGTTLSAFWILSANSWMQFPAGHEVRDGIAYPVDWLKIIFNPTFPTRLAHMLLAAYITTAFVVLAVGARWLLKGMAIENAKTMIRMALGILIVLVPIQAFVGDASGLNTLKYQPVKLAAMEAHWGEKDGTKGPIPWVLFAWPNEEQERNDFQVAIPYVGSLIFTHSLDGSIKGLKEFSPDLRPPIAIPFFAFRIMIAMWGVMMLTIITGGVLWWRKSLFHSERFLRFSRFIWPIGFVTILAGWYTTEVGRQPWVATGILRTVDAVSPASASAMLTSLLLLTSLYVVIYGAALYYMNRLINAGPDVAQDSSAFADHASPLRPMSAAQEAGRKAMRVED